jgi:hypothetical protein
VSSNPIFFRFDEYFKFESSVSFSSWPSSVDQYGFRFSGDIYKPLSLVHLVTLSAASFNLASALIGALLLVITTNRPRISESYMFSQFL